ncbi:protein phosphatase 1 regulatory subunit 12B-like isoform X3 [Macrobrachium nipponense]|uniref:protein phosphatase 1 regulatory subunit 12B-like isoform X3 n=1 Tax=Macrobrachium nipponense TaxID=159736 RepID=UPI0030C8CE64
MAVDNRSTSALFKRAEQLRRWQDSETNKTDVTVNNRNTKVNFSDGCIFLAACAAGDKQEVLRLLEKGADINTANVDGLTGLHAACIDDNIDMVEFLVNQGADVNRADMEGWTPLHATASCGFISIAKFLIDRGADLSIVNNDGDLPFDIADSEEMESLLKKEIETRGIDCDASRNEEERMMLEDAQRWLAAGFLADRPHPKTGATALHVAAAKGYSKVMSLLLEAGSDINAQDLDGWTPLHAAAHWCQRDAVEILCEHMADMDKQNFVGQTAYDVADSTLLLLMDELKRKQKALKLVNTNKQQVPRKRKTSPHREHSNKKEREDLRESDGTSDDESSSDVDDEESSEDTTSSDSSDSSESDSEEEDDNDDDSAKENEDGGLSGSCTRALSPLHYLVEKKNKVNKEKNPQIIPTSPDKNNTRTVPQAKGENAMDESEVQSWRRPSSLRKPLQDDKNQEVSRTISTPTRVNNRESEDLTGKRISLPEKDESSLSATRERLKARSCPVLSQLEEEEVIGGGGGGGVGGGAWPQTRPHSRAEGIPTPRTSSSSTSPLILYQRLSSSDLNIPNVQNMSDLTHSSSSVNVTNHQLIKTTFTPLCTSMTCSSTKINTSIAKTNLNSSFTPMLTHTSASSDSLLSTGSIPSSTSVTSTISSCLMQPGSTNLHSLHKPLGSSMSTPILSSSNTHVSSSIPTSVSPSSTTIITTSTTTTGLASLSTNQSTNNKDPRLLARSASLRERIQRNHVDSMARVTSLQEPLVSTNSVLTTNTSQPVRSIGSNVTTLTTNGGLTTSIPPPPKTAPTLTIQTKLPNTPSPTSPTAPSIPAVSPVSVSSAPQTYPSQNPPSHNQLSLNLSPQNYPPQNPQQGSPVSPNPPSGQPPAASKMTPGSVIKNFFNLVHSSRSFVPPSRDEESETQRKAHAKMVRSTRRSTQGVTLEDIKSAEQLMKNKQQQASTSSPESRESSASTVSMSVPQGSTTTTTTPSSPKPASPTKSEDEERRPSWRLKVDDADKTKFCLENVRSKDKQEDNDSDTQTVTVQLRKKNTEDKGDEDQKDNERNSQTREGTQAAIQRRKKPKRRSTGRVQVNMDEIDPEKRAQRLAEQQQQQQQDDNRSDDGEEEDDSVSVLPHNVVSGRCLLLQESVSERGDSKGPTSSHGSSAVNSRPSSRGSSLGPENGDIDYKKLYEEQLEENFRVHERLRGTETELRLAREAIETNNKKNNTRLAMAEADKREKRALERKLSEMEEELKQLQKLKAENEKLKAENRALTRVVSKLTNSATAGMGNLASLSK